MTSAEFTVIPLAKQDRTTFRCGTDPLDNYFHRQVSQDIRKRVTSCYIAVHTLTEQIAGFYTLSAADIPVTDIPIELAKGLPRYPSLPVARIGRLAVDKCYKGKKLGSALLFDAVTRAAKSDVAVFGVVVDAKDASAEAFYKHHGFCVYGSVSGLLMASLKQLLG